jgi:hypothetical protein
MLKNENKCSILSQNCNIQNRSNGCDWIFVKLIKHCRFTILPVLVGACSSALTTCIFPELLKISKTVSICKNGKKVLVSNHRPILVLSNFSKLIERFIIEDWKAFIHELIFLMIASLGFFQNQIQ